MFLPLYRLADTYRYRGDAAEYLLLSDKVEFGPAVLAPPGGRTVGFPLLLRVLRIPFAVIAPWFDLPWYELVPPTMLVFHAIVCTVAFRKLQSHRWFAAPTYFLLLLIAHPGLVSHTTVLLTDTFATDLVLLTMPLTASVLTAHSRRALALNTLLGLVLALVVLVRPFLLLGTLGFLTVLIVIAAIRRRPHVAAVLLGASLLLLPAVLSCRARFGSLCLQDPTFAARSAEGSASAGFDNVRTYWSARAKPPQYAELVSDPQLTTHVRGVCGASTSGGFVSAVSCVLVHPISLTLLVAKKSIALLDARHLTPYLVDLTPRWVQRGMRVVGCITWVGIFAGIALFIGRLRAQIQRQPENGTPHRPWDFLAVSALPLLTFFSYAFMHVEPRYGFAVVPFAWLALGTWLRERVARRWVFAAVLGIVFMTQVSVWDGYDSVQMQIDAARPRLP